MMRSVDAERCRWLVWMMMKEGWFEGSAGGVKYLKKFGGRGRLIVQQADSR